MALNSLIVCADDATSHTLREILGAIGLSIEICPDVKDAFARLGARRYDSVILDCDRELEAREVLQRSRDVCSGN